MSLAVRVAGQGRFVNSGLESKVDGEKMSVEEIPNPTIRFQNLTKTCAELLSEYPSVDLVQSQKLCLH